MNVKNKLIHLSFLFLPLVFPSCEGTCTCKKDLGCTIVTAVGYSDTLLKEKKSFCSNVNYYPDQVRIDSVKSFTLRHTYDSTWVVTKDSIYYSQTTEKVNSNDTKHFENLGYTCVCFK